MGLNYPKDQGTEWMNIKRQVRDAFTSANSRVPYQKIAAGVLKVSTSLEVLAGAFMKFTYESGEDGIFLGNQVFLGDTSEGLVIRRNNGNAAFTSFTRVSDGEGFTGIWDKNEEIVLSDDQVNGGLARPWIPHTMATTAELTTPPANRQTSSTSDTEIYSTVTHIQHPRMRFHGYVYIQNPGATIELKFKNITTGTTMYTGTHGTAWASADFDFPAGSFGDDHQFDITIRRNAGTGNVGFTLLSLHGRQT